MDPLARIWQQLVSLNAGMVQMQSQIVAATSMWAGGLEGVGKRFDEIEKRVQRLRDAVLGTLAEELRDMHEDLRLMNDRIIQIEEKVDKISTTATYGFMV